MPARGEYTIDLPDGNEIRIIYTNFALATAEGRIGKPVLGVARAMAEGQASITDLAHLLRAGMEAAGRENGRRGPVSLKDAYDVMDQIGLTKTITAILEAVTAVIMYQGEATDPN